MNNKNLSQIMPIFASLAVLLVAFASVSASAAGLGNPQQFAVEMKMTGDIGEIQGQEMSMTFYVGKNRLRVEMNTKMMAGMSGGMAHIYVFDGDEVTTYTLMLAMKQYMKTVVTSDDYMDEGPVLVFGSPDDAEHPCQADPNMSCEKIGSDTVLGRPVDKYLVKDIEDGVPVESMIWFDRELLMPIKMAGEDGVMEATSIKFGAQPDKLFEIPAGYKEMKIPNY